MADGSESLFYGVSSHVQNLEGHIERTNALSRELPETTCETTSRLDVIHWSGGHQKQLMFRLPDRHYGHEDTEHAGRHLAGRDWPEAGSIRQREPPVPLPEVDYSDCSNTESLRTTGSYLSEKLSSAHNFATHHCGSTYSADHESRIKSIQEPTELDKLTDRIRCYRTVIIVLACFVTLTVAAVASIVTLTVIGPCAISGCVNGKCDESLSILNQPVCRCDVGWTGLKCDIEIKTNTSRDSLSLTWDTEATGDELGFRVFYEEEHFYPNEISMETQDNHVTITSVKPRVIYIINIMSIAWDHTMQSVATQQKLIGKTKAEVDITWNETASNARGYLVSATRVQKRKEGFLTLDKDAREAKVDNLDECSSYRFRVVKVKDDYSEEIIEDNIGQTECVAAGWRVGDSVIKSGDWNGGTVRLLHTTHCNQPDYFPAPVANPSCPGDETTGRVGEAIVNTSAHTGRQSWHYKRGHPPTAHGAACPYSPPLSLEAGRSDGNHSGDVDGFYARFWIKAANSSGDDSSIEVAGGNNRGMDRESTMVFIKAYSTGLDIWTFDCDWEHCVAHRNCSYSYVEVYLARNLSLLNWHRIEIELQSMNDDYSDQWTYHVDGARMYEGGSYLAAWSMENLDYKYNDYVNRLKFKPRHEVRDPAFQGFYLDDIYYQVFNWSNKEDILDSYETSFEL